VPHTRGKLSLNIKHVAKFVKGYLLLYKNMKYKSSVKIISFNVKNEEHVYEISTGQRNIVIPENLTSYLKCTKACKIQEQNHEYF